MTGKIFLSYRRDDTTWFARALFSQLERSFPAETLFMDVKGIEPGQDFVRAIEKQVMDCDAMLVQLGGREAHRHEAFIIVGMAVLPFLLRPADAAIRSMAARQRAK